MYSIKLYNLNGNKRKYVRKDKITMLNDMIAYANYMRLVINDLKSDIDSDNDFIKIGD